MPENQSETLPPYDEAAEMALTGTVLERLLRDDSALPELEEAMHTGDVRAFRAVLERNDAARRTSTLVCRWICSWHVQRRCLWVCRDHEIATLKPAEIAQATVGLARLAQEEGALEKLVETLDSGDGEGFEKLLERFDLHVYCRLICVLILTVRCELFCLLAVPAGPHREAPAPGRGAARPRRRRGALAEDDQVLDRLLDGLPGRPLRRGARRPGEAPAGPLLPAGVLVALRGRAVPALHAGLLRAADRDRGPASTR